MIRILNIVGARPQFIKLAPFVQAIDAHNQSQGPAIESLTVHTGQHYDHGMSDIFFEELEIPPADVNLGIGSGSHGAQTGKMLEGIERVLKELAPQVVVVFGDTNSTLAGTLAATKLHIPVAHVEAGLRSFNRRMPEEINRIVADHSSDLLLAPTQTAVSNLEKEGLGAKTVLSGDIMYDTVLRNRVLAQEKSSILQQLDLRPDSYYIATVHRAENTDAPERLAAILQVFNEFAQVERPLIFPMHPRTKHKIAAEFPDWSPKEGLRIIEPVGYLDMLNLVGNAQIAFTDSGGLQKEAFFLNIPCITLRDETEWVETVEAGANLICGADPDLIRKAHQHWEGRFREGPIDLSPRVKHYFGDGASAGLTLSSILDLLG